MDGLALSSAISSVRSSLVRVSGVEIPPEISSDHTGNDAGFLRHHNNHSIGMLGNADGRPMPGAKIPAQIRILGQGQYASGCRNPLTANDHCAVMQRRLGEKDILQQLCGNRSIHNGAGFKVFLQIGLPLKHNQRADFLPGHTAAGRNRFVDGMGQITDLCFGYKQPLDAAAAQALQQPPSFGWNTTTRAIRPTSMVLLMI